MLGKWVETKGIQAEYGSTGNINWLDSSQVTMSDSEGNEVKCKCGKKATAMSAGENSFAVWCSDCSPWGEKK